MDESLQDVAIALGAHARQVGFVFLFLLVMVYVYAILGYALLADVFVLPESEQPACTTLWQCLLTTLDHGVRVGDLGGGFEPLVSPNVADLSEQQTFKFYFQLAYTFSFWFIVIVILLNAVLAIIIDSFSELRGRRKEIREKNESECFICGIDRFRLDTKGGGFQKHIKEHHHMWNYLYLIIALREKDDTDHNGWESWVASRVALNDTSFLPRDAISLQAVTEAEEAEEQARSAQAAQTASTVAEVCQICQTLTEKQESVDSKLTMLTDLVTEMMSSRQRGKASQPQQGDSSSESEGEGSSRAEPQLNRQHSERL